MQCFSYLQGYLGGAYAMRTLNDRDVPQKRSDFVERAQRTRAGNTDMRFGANRQAGYCLPTDLALDDFAAGLQQFGESTPDRSELANQFVLAFLRKAYAC